MLLPAGNASEWTGPTGNNTYLLSGSPSVLIDAGVGHPDHLAALERALDGAVLDLLLITHDHVDHVAGVPALRERWPRLVIRGEAGAPLCDGERIEAGLTTLVALHTPGHSPDHFCFFDEGGRELYCGDLARTGGTVVIPASRGGNLSDYLHSLRRVRNLEPKRLMPAHGPIVDDPIRLIDDYIAHRAERSHQILGALDNGCLTVAEIVDQVYPGLSQRLRDAAAETVRAHLEWLKLPIRE